jgi:hypothetical protein
VATSLKYAIEIEAQTKGLKKGLKETANEVEKQVSKTTRVQKKNATQIDSLKKQLADNESKYIKESAKEAIKQSKKQLAAAKGDAVKEFEIREKLYKKLEALRKRAEKADEKSDVLGGIGKGAKKSESGIDSLGASLGNLTSKLGPVGVGATAALGTITALGAGAVACAEKFTELSNGMKILGDTAGYSDKEVTLLTEQLQSLRRPAEMTTAELTDIATTVSTFVDSADEVPGVTQDILDLIKLYPDVNPTEAVQGFQRFTQQLGSTEKAMNYMSAQAEFMRGKSLDPLGEAGSELNTVFKKSNKAITDTAKSVERAQQLFNSFIGTGYEVGESTSTAEIIFENLAETMTDTTAVEKWRDALKGTGTTIEEIGLVTGDIDPARLLNYFNSGAEGADKLKRVMQPTITDLLTLDENLKKQGKTIDDFAIKNEGAGQKVQEFAINSRRGAEDLSQNWEKLMINMGASTAQGVGRATGILAEFVGSVADMFEPASVSMAKATAEAEKFNTIALDLNRVLENPSPNTEAQLSLIESRLTEINEVSPYANDEIQKILENESMLTEEKLREINKLLEGTISLSGQLSEGKAFEAMADSAQVLIDKMYEFTTDAEYFSAALSLPASDLVILRKSFEDVENTIPRLTSEIETLRDEANALPKGSDEYATKLTQIGEKYKELNELQYRQKGFQDSIIASTKSIVDLESLTAQKTGEKLDVEEVYLTALAKSPDILRDSLQYQEQLRTAVEEQVKTANDGLNQEIANQKIATDAKNEQTLSQLEYMEYLRSSLALETDTTSEYYKQQSAKLDQLETQRTQLAEQLKQLQTQGSITLAEEQTKKQKIETLQATREMLVADRTAMQAKIDSLRNEAATQQAFNQLLVNAVNLAGDFVKNLGLGEIAVQTAEDKTSEIISNLEKQISNYSDAIEKIDKQIAGLKAPEVTKVEVPETPEGKEVKKLLKETSRNVRDYNTSVDDSIKITNKHQDARTKQIDKEIQTSQRLTDAMEERMRAEEELRKNILSFTDEIIKNVNQFTGSQRDLLRSLVGEFQPALDTFQQAFKDFQSNIDTYNAEVEGQIRELQTGLERRIEEIKVPIDFSIEEDLITQYKQRYTGPRGERIGGAELSDALSVGYSIAAQQDLIKNIEAERREIMDKIDILLRSEKLIQKGITEEQAEEVKLLTQYLDRQRTINDLRKELSATIDKESRKEIEDRIALEERALQITKNTEIFKEKGLDNLKTSVEYTLLSKELTKASEQIEEQYVNYRDKEVAIAEQISILKEEEKSLSVNTLQNANMLTENLSEQSVAMQNLLLQKQQELVIEEALINEGKSSYEQYEAIQDQIKQINRELDDTYDKLDETAQKTEDIYDDLTKSLTDSLMTLSDPEFSRASEDMMKGIKEFRVALSESDFEGKIQASAKIAAGFVNILQSIPDVVDSVKEAVGAKGAAGGVEVVSQTLQSVGSALMQSGVGPLVIAGAAIFAAGIIGGIVGKIMKAFQKNEKSAKDIANDRKKAQEQITKEYEAQKDYLDDLIALGDSRVDSLQEQLRFEKRIHEELASSNEERERLTNMTDRDLVKLKLRLQATKALSEAEKIRNETTLEMIEQELDYRQKIASIDREIEDRRQEILETMIDIAIETGDYNKALEYTAELTSEIVDNLKEQLSAETAIGAKRATGYQIGKTTENKNTPSPIIASIIGQTKSPFEGMSDDELYEFLLGLSPSDIAAYSEETQDAIFAFLETYKKTQESIRKAEEEGFRDEFSEQEKLIKLRIEAGEISEEEGKQQLLDLYNEELQRVVELNEDEAYRLELVAEIKKLEEEINDELTEQTKTQTKLANLVRLRQQELQRVREGSADQRALERRDAEIRAELAAQGLSQSEIEAFMRTLPSRQTGGGVNEGAYYLHDNEYVMNALAVAKYGSAFMDRLNNLQVETPASPAIGYLTQRAMENNSTQNIQIVVNVSNDWNVSDGTKAKEISAMQQGDLYDAINAGIKSRKINLLLGGRP